jgi:predicted Zn-dependent protease with MMP-like domain
VWTRCIDLIRADEAGHEVEKDDTTGYTGVLPDRIIIYRHAICAICAICQTEQEVDGQVRRTVIHEIAHHFGIDDRRLRELGW